MAGGVRQKLLSGLQFAEIRRNGPAWGEVVGAAAGVVDQKSKPAMGPPGRNKKPSGPPANLSDSPCLTASDDGVKKEPAGTLRTHSVEPVGRRRRSQERLPAGAAAIPMGSGGRASSVAAYPSGPRGRIANPLSPSTTPEATGTYKTPSATPTSNPDTSTTNPAGFEPDLAALIAAWPDLPKPIRAGIVAMVKAAVTRDNTTSD
jgi:hypothetical protein